MKIMTLGCVWGCLYIMSLTAVTLLSNYGMNGVLPHRITLALKSSNTVGVRLAVMDQQSLRRTGYLKQVVNLNKQNLD